MVSSQQQQLRRNRIARIAQLFRKQPAAVPRKLLREEQEIRSQGAHGRSSRVHIARRRQAAGGAGGAAPDSPEAARRNLSRDIAVQRSGSHTETTNAAESARPVGRSSGRQPEAHG